MPNLFVTFVPKWIQLMLLPHENTLQVVIFLHADQRSHWDYSTTIIINNFPTLKFQFYIALEKLSPFSTIQKSRRLMS